jgi:cell division protein ZipA
MDGLRWIILLLGIVVVIAIYFYTAQQKRSPRRDQDDEPDIESISMHVGRDEHEPEEYQDELVNLDAMLREEQAAHTAHEAEQAAEDQTEDAPVQQQHPAEPGEEMFVILHVTSRLPERFRGSDVLNALEACSLSFGPMGIFHRQREIDGQLRTLFSVANMVKPGTLIPDQLAEDTELPGVSMFMRLPSSIAGTDLLREMLECAHCLSETLGGRVLDETRSTLTQQLMHKIMEDVQQFEFKQKTR